MLSVREFSGFSPRKLVALCLEAADKAVKALQGMEDIYDFVEAKDDEEDGVDVDMAEATPAAESPQPKKKSLFKRLFGG